MPILSKRWETAGPQSRWARSLRGSEKPLRETALRLASDEEVESAAGARGSEEGFWNLEVASGAMRLARIEGVLEVQARSFEQDPSEPCSEATALLANGDFDDDATKALDRFFADLDARMRRRPEAFAAGSEVEFSRGLPQNACMAAVPAGTRAIVSSDQDDRAKAPGGYELVSVSLADLGYEADEGEMVEIYAPVDALAEAPRVRPAGAKKKARR